MGLDTFPKVHEQAPHVPIIVLTGMNAEEVALEAMKLGAEDYLVKSQIDSRHLVRSIQYSVERG